jgi:hypothetical protein
MLKNIYIFRRMKTQLLHLGLVPARMSTTKSQSLKRHLAAFQDGYERSLAACAVLDGENEYRRVSVGRLGEGLIFEDECEVTGDSSE